jgi:hypothetical protein
MSSALEPVADSSGLVAEETEGVDALAELAVWFAGAGMVVGL